MTCAAQSRAHRQMAHLSCQRRRPHLVRQVGQDNKGHGSAACRGVQPVGTQPQGGRAHSVEPFSWRARFALSRLSLHRRRAWSSSGPCSAGIGLQLCGIAQPPPRPSSGCLRAHLQRLRSEVLPVLLWGSTAKHMWEEAIHVTEDGQDKLTQMWGASPAIVSGAAGGLPSVLPSCRLDRGSHVEVVHRSRLGRVQVRLGACLWPTWGPWRGAGVADPNCVGKTWMRAAREDWHSTIGLYSPRHWAALLAPRAAIQNTSSRGVDLWSRRGPSDVAGHGTWPARAFLRFACFSPRP